MRLLVKRKDARGNITNQVIELPWLAFVKHMAISGQGYIPAIRKFWRMLGMFFLYSDYMGHPFNHNSSFSQPPVPLYDPTSTAQFSNIAGKAIADFLAKRLDGATVTFGYEAALKSRDLPIRGKRPDLLCANPLSHTLFSIESKGFSKNYISSREMTRYKRQAVSRWIPVSFHVASVAYNLYNQVKVKYHDPKNEDFEYDKELVKKLSIQYYQGVKEFLNKEIFEIKREFINENNYYRLTFHPDRRHNFYPFFLPYCELFDRLSILIDVRVSDFAKKGIGETKMEQYVSDENVYIDSDGIGLMLL